MMTFLCDWGAVTLFTYLDERARRRRVTWDRGFYPRIGLGGFLDRLSLERTQKSHPSRSKSSQVSFLTDPRSTSTVWIAFHKNPLQ